MRRYAIILIAGLSRRFLKGDKCLVLVNGKPIALYSLEAFQKTEIFDHYLFVYRDEKQKDALEKHLKIYCSAKISSQIIWVNGGKERMFSVFNALKFIDRQLPPEAFVFIHDGARPMLSTENILKINTLLSPEYGVVLAHRTTNTTILIAEEIHDNLPFSMENHISKIRRKYLHRDKLWGLETPQAFYFPKIFEDYQRIIPSEISFTDDSAVFSGTITLLENNSLNLKITSFQDLTLFKSLRK